MSDLGAYEMFEKWWNDPRDDGQPIPLGPISKESGWWFWQAGGFEGWKEAAIAWSVCASIHEQWAKGKDALYKTRHADFKRHAERARKLASELDQMK